MAIWPAKKDPVWPAKKEPDENPAESEVSEGAPETGSDAPDRFRELTERLAGLGQLLDQTNRQVVEYLIHRESQATAGQPAAKAASEGTLNAALRPLQERLDQVDAKLKALAQRPAEGVPEDSIGPALAQIRDGLNQQYAALAEGIRQVHGSLNAGLQNLQELLRPAEPEPPAAGPATSSDWQRIIFGPELAEHPGLEFQRQQLLNGLMEGDPGACSLIGQLLVFRSALTEKMPPLLKEIGEAYYRWQPKTRPGTTKMEEVLVEWLGETMQDAGIANTIELVHPGQRFDSTRHSAATRGVEITEVRGWIVLRDNGKVYTKASVAVK